MRIARCIRCCMSWHLIVDGNDCTSPGPVEAVVYQYANYLIVRHSHFTGMCRQAQGRNISAGQCAMIVLCVCQFVNVVSER